MAKTVKKHENIYIHIRKSIVKWLALWLICLYTYVSIIVYIGKTDDSPEIIGWFWVIGVGMFMVFGAGTMLYFLIWILVEK